MMTLKKVSLRYSQVEDRIRMDAESESGEVLCFWLTQRMCRELVRSLINYFATADLQRSKADPGHVFAVQGYLHQQAKQDKKPVPPVKNPPLHSSLVSRVRLRTSSKVISMTLPLADGSESVLPFTVPQARQWLEILYQQCRAAEWPLDFWPGWITGVNHPEAAPPGGALH